MNLRGAWKKSGRRNCKRSWWHGNGRNSQNDNVKERPKQLNFPPKETKEKLLFQASADRM